MRHLIPFLAVVAFVLSTAPAHADLGDQLYKLLPDDGAEFDRFGWSVAISPDSIGIAIVGAPSDFVDGIPSGSTYLFDITTGEQIAKFVPNDGAAGDRFGTSVAISGTIAIVGASGNDDNGESSGSAYLFDISDPANPMQLFTLLPDDGAAGERFGVSVSISPDGIGAIVGAYRDDDNGDWSGSAYLFNTTTGQQLFKLLPNDGAEDDEFGGSVGISGTRAIVGAFWDDDNGSNSGSAYLFDTATGRQIAKLLPDDGVLGGWFGRSVAISGATAILGAPNQSGNSEFSGAAYLFETDEGQQIAKLFADDGAASDIFGLSIAISPDGSGAIVGAVGDDDNGNFSGSAYLFDTTTGRQTAKLLANDGASEDWFSWSVAINGSTAIVGARGHDDNGTESGSAYLFDASSCPWDIDGNGSVGASDLLSLLASWGPCKGCPADFDGNGTVSASDLLALLANWGPCP